jgi:hypothetical protein
MELKINDYVDSYIQDAEDFDGKVAQHLKEIIPKTTHLDERIFKEIIHELKKEMDGGADFKAAFSKIHEIHFLKGDKIDADLPALLTRIILNKAKFIFYVKKKLKGAYTTREIERVLTSGKKRRMMRLLGRLKLAKKNVVFAVFDEKRKDGNPFLKNNVAEIIDRLALNKNIFRENEVPTAVKIRYKNREDAEKRFPTFVDAGWYDKFFPAKSDAEYGRTKPLSPGLHGMPEVVHENLRLVDVMEDVELLEDKID